MSTSSDEELTVKKSKKEAKKGKKRMAEKNDEEGIEEDKIQNSKKAKTETNGRPKDEHGNELFEFGNMRFASVSSFKGKEYLNIREYYIDKNTQKMMPSKKGISLNKAQWNNLKDIIPELDKQFS